MTDRRQHRIASYNKGCRCPQCRQAARDKQRRIRIQRTQHSQLPYQCIHCGQRFDTMQGLGTHTSAIHPEHFTPTN